MFFNRSFAKYIIPLILVILLVSCKAGMMEEDQETTFAVNISRTNRSHIVDYLELSGDVRTKNEVQVLPDTNGKLTRLLVNLGDKVERNQVVAYIDPSRPGMNFALSPVKSPISGSVISMPVKIGTTVAASTPVISVGKLADIEIITHISEKYISRIKKGQKTIITVGAYPNVDFDGYVAELSPIVDISTRMMEIKIAVRPNGYQLKPGMFADIKIITAEKSNIIKIPSDAVITRFNNKIVFIKKEIPDEVTNIELDNSLLAKLTDSTKQDALKALFPPELPGELKESKYKVLMMKINLFAKRLKEIAKQSKTKQDEKEQFNPKKAAGLVSKLYKAEGDKKDKKYVLSDSASDEDKKELWDLMVKIEFSFDIPRKEVQTETEMEKIKSIIEETGYDRGHVEKRTIITGIETEGMIEVVEGVSENEDIVVLGQSLLADSVKIKIMERNELK